MTYRVSEEEWYPVITVDDIQNKKYEEFMGDLGIVPDDLAKRYEKALAEFRAVQDELSKITTHEWEERLMHIWGHI